MLNVRFSLENPYRPRDKCIAPLVGAGLIAGGASMVGSVASGILGNKSTRDTNRQNLQIARETNQSNETINMRAIQSQEAMQAYQNRWNLEQWNRENEYNSPAAQVARLRAAGVNPYLDSNISPGEASSLQGSAASMPGQASMQGANMAAPDMSWIGNAVTSGVSAYMQNQLLQTQIDKGAADAQISEANARTQSLRNAHELMKIANDASRSEFERDLARESLDVYKATKDNQIYHSVVMNKMLDSQIDEVYSKIGLNNLQSDAIEIANRYAPNLNDAQLSHIRAGIAELYSSAKANNAQALESGARKLLIDAQKVGQKISNRQASLMVDAIVDEAMNRADESYWQAQTAKQDYSKGKAGRLFGASDFDAPASDRRYRNYIRGRVGSKGRKVPHARSGVR